MSRKNIFDRLTLGTSKRPAAIHVHLQKMMRKYGITTGLRMASLFSQLAAETGRLNFMMEGGPDSYFSKYEPGADQGKKLGNTHPGDGKRFKGRGMIQITGRFNYQSYGRYKGDASIFLSDAGASSLCNDPNLTCDSSGHFWAAKQRMRRKTDEPGKLEKLGSLGINYWADRGFSTEDILQVTRCINSAAHAFEEIRWPCFEHAWHAVNDEVLPNKNFKMIES